MLLDILENATDGELFFAVNENHLPVQNKIIAQNSKHYFPKIRELLGLVKENNFPLKAFWAQLGVLINFELKDKNIPEPLKQSLANPPIPITNTPVIDIDVNNINTNNEHIKSIYADLWEMYVTIERHYGTHFNKTLLNAKEQRHKDKHDHFIQFINDLVTQLQAENCSLNLIKKLIATARTTANKNTYIAEKTNKSIFRYSKNYKHHLKNLYATILKSNNNNNNNSWDLFFDAFLLFIKQLQRNQMPVAGKLLEQIVPMFNAFTNKKIESAEVKANLPTPPDSPYSPEFNEADYLPEDGGISNKNSNTNRYTVRYSGNFIQFHQAANPFIANTNQNINNNNQHNNNANIPTTRRRSFSWHGGDTGSSY
jgi:hypothetical protein